MDKNQRNIPPINMTPEVIRRRLDDILPHVEKPARYFAGEIGLRRKAWDEAKVRMAVGFPDVYEIAAGNLGHHLIQHIVNSRDAYLAERVYSPWPDMEARLRASETPLYSLESFRAIGSFDVFGVSLTHEMNFTNFLQLIDLSQLPLRASDRGFPIVIAGGPAVFNPEPLWAFVDAFILGDGEEIILELLREVEIRRDHVDRVRGDVEAEIKLKREILNKWGGAGGVEGVQGVYVPSHFKIETDEHGSIASIKNVAGGPDVIQKAIVTDLDSQPWKLDLPTPHIQGLSNRVVVEPVRGCTHGCRFCQAGMIYRPWRQRSLDLLINQAERLLESTGLQEQSFLALAATDWQYLQEFIRQMQSVDRDFHLRISLPSGRIATLDKSLTDLLISNRKGGLTLAIEAATPRLRAVINKDASDDDIVRAVENAVMSDWDLIKLYFMIGLPTETGQDVLAIIELVERITDIHYRLRREHKTNVGRLKIKVSVSSFVPKAHTPFQWAPMDTPETLDRKQKMLMPLRRIKGVEYKSHDIPTSWIEGVVARGDRILADVLEQAYRNGARFDAWGDWFDAILWKDAFEQAGVDPDKYIGGRDIDEILPWEHLSCGVDKDWLKEDWLRALKETMIPDCNESKCLNCGIHGIYKECRPERIGKKTQ